MIVETQSNGFSPELDAVMGELIETGKSLKVEGIRKKALEDLAAYIKSKQPENAKLNFICTQNSRRSHLSQMICQGLVIFSGLNIDTYSGGTEATAIHPNTIRALKSTGFSIQDPHEMTQNPVYIWQVANKEFKLYSKVYNEPPNPTSGYAAIMVCSRADADCPVVFGSDIRISLPYEDPKHFDGTEQEDEAYIEKIREIGTELAYVFNLVKK